MPVYRMDWTEATGNGDTYTEVRCYEELEVDMNQPREQQTAGFFNLFRQLEDCGACPEFSVVPVYGPNLKTEKRWKRDGWLRSPESRSGWEPRYIVEDVPFQCGCDMCLGIEK